MAAPQVIIGLSAVVAAMREGEAVVLTVQPDGPDAARPSSTPGLPSGPFDPATDRTFELAMRAFVTEQTGFELGYVEQLYTFGDKGRDAPLADFREARSGGGRIVSVGYLALAPGASDLAEHFDAGARWTGWSRFFPWEDWREGRPAVIDEMIAPALLKWAKGETQSEADVRQARIRLLFALDGARWNDCLLYTSPSPRD